MNIWIAILGFFVSSITCFAIGIRVWLWGRQSREEEFQKQFIVLSKTNIKQGEEWTNAMEEFRELFHRFIIANGVQEAKAYRLQKEIDHLLELHLGPCE